MSAIRRRLPATRREQKIRKRRCNNYRRVVISSRRLHDVWVFRQRRAAVRRHFKNHEERIEQWRKTPDPLRGPRPTCSWDGTVLVWFTK